MSDQAQSPITADALHALLRTGGELAILDVREPLVTKEQGSILLGVSAPLSRLELNIDALVPRRSTPVVVYDGGSEGLAERAVHRLGELGYTDVRSLDGGLGAWSDAGFKVQTGGTQVIGQAFGEFIEDVYKTPHITVGEFRERVANGEDVVLLDSRPITEFESHSLPGGTSIPGAELVYRAAEVIPSPESLVVVNCAGRTRSIIGAQVLINAGLPNKVVALEGGTQSWILEGFDVEHGKHVTAPLPSAASLEQAKAGAARIAERFGVKTIDAKELEQFRSEADERSLYLLDVRSLEEFEKGHVPGSRSTPSWEVSPWVFRHVATRNARIVLIDDADLVRATVSASWLIQIGWGEVYVAKDALTTSTLETGPAKPRVLGLPIPDLDLIEPQDLQRELEASEPLQVVDLQLSTTYRVGHIPQALFAIRSRIVESLDRIPGTGPIVLTSEDGKLAKLAAAELAEATKRPVKVLKGGNAGWEALGLPLETELHQLNQPDDAADSPWQEKDPERQKEGFRRYLAWEVGLVEQLSQDDTVPFKTFA
jgi:rhodanese-related sulfurtransferase